MLGWHQLGVQGWRNPKKEGVQVDDFDIRSNLGKIQPDPINIKSKITQENVSNIPEHLR